MNTSPSNYNDITKYFKQIQILWTSTIWQRLLIKAISSSKFNQSLNNSNTAINKSQHQLKKNNLTINYSNGFTIKK